MSAVHEWIALTFAPGLGVTTFWRLIDYFGSPADVLRARGKDLLHIPGVRDTQVAGLVNSQDVLNKAEKELTALQKIGAETILYTDEIYPNHLKDLTDPPPVLYLLGNKRHLQAPKVAIVGSRAATTYGRRIAYNLASELSRHNVVVVSGLALGIDSEAHRGALAAQSPTIGVLGCGLDVVYPKQNSFLYDRMVGEGAVISEYPLGTRPEPFRFPARNRIIAGLADGIVVVEATKKSGSLITAQIGLDLNRDIFAVPGQVDSVKSEGTHWLLQQGAKLVSSVEDILAELNVTPGDGSAVEQDRISEIADVEDPELIKFFSILENYPLSRDELMSRVNVSPARLSEMLLLLELDGKVEILPGNQVRKI